MVWQPLQGQGQGQPVQPVQLLVAELAVVSTIEYGAMRSLSSDEDIKLSMFGRESPKIGKLPHLPQTHVGNYLSRRPGDQVV